MRTKLLVAVSVMAAAVGLAAPAFAVGSTDPTVQTTTLMTSGTAQLFPLIVAVATGALGLLVLTVGIQTAWKAFKSRGKKVV
jgi:hypothetical protein